MPELTINADEITAALKRYVDDYTPEVGTEHVGRIVEVGDGIARITGLPGAAVNETAATSAAATANPRPLRFATFMMAISVLHS